MRHFLNGIPVHRALPTHCASFSSDKGPKGNTREEVYWGCVQMVYSLVRVHILYFIASLVAQLVKKTHLQYRRPGFDLWIEKIPWRWGRLPTPVFWPGEFPPKESDTTE